MSDGDMNTDQSTTTRHQSSTGSRSFSNPPVAGKIVVVAVDASAHSKLAFDWYINTIHRNEDLVVLTHIPEVPDLPLFSFKEGLNLPTHDWTDALKRQIDTVQQLQCDYQRDLVARQIKFKIAGSANRSTGIGIIKVAQEENAEMIVLGSRGLSVARRALIGSVSDYITRESNVPVVIVPGGVKKVAGSTAE